MPSDDLFTAAADAALAERGPLAHRLRPHTLDDVVGQRHLLAPGRPLRALIDADRLSSAILWGPPGVGKTTIARLIADASAKAFVPMSAVSATVSDVRTIIANARQRLGAHGSGTILFLDEIHRFNRAQQDTLLPAVEDGSIVLIGATTENPHFSLNAPLMSRSTLFRLQPLTVDDLIELANRAATHEGVAIEPDAAASLAERAGGDGRHTLTSLDVAIALAAEDRRVTVTVADIDDAFGAAAVRYGRDDHFDVISAFIKSIRGSDPDAALHWLARMVEAGEDPRYIARRLVVSASEDIGLADPTALLLATAAAQAVEFVGFPEARLNLAHVTVHLALAPKSNTAYAAYGRAAADVQKGGFGEVPLPLRDASIRGSRQQGHGRGYRYPHDQPSGWVDQQYLPDALVERVYYEPGPHGREGGTVDQWRRRRGELGTAAPEPSDAAAASDTTPADTPSNDIAAPAPRTTKPADTAPNDSTAAAPGPSGDTTAE